MDGQQHMPPKSKEPDDYEAASRATASDSYEDYEKRKAFSYSAPTHHGRKTFLIILLVIVLLGGLGYGAYWFLSKKDSNKSSDKSASNSQQGADQQSTDEKLITTETEHYTSNSFMLEFDYPKDWKISEPTDGGLLTGKSPVIALKQADGKSITGQVVFTIRNKQQAMPEFDKGNSTAVLASEKINYTKPSSAQRGSTYLSFLTYAGSTQDDRLDGVFITGDVGYQKGQAIPKADFTPVDPVISVTFLKCADQACSGEGTQAGIDAAMWQQTDFGAPIKTMLQSLVIN